MNPTVQFRITVVDPPESVSFALQRGWTELVGATRIDSTGLVFEFTAQLADITSTPPRLTGPYMQGPPAKRRETRIAEAHAHER